MTIWKPVLNVFWRLRGNLHRRTVSTLQTLLTIHTTLCVFYRYTWSGISVSTSVSKKGWNQGVRTRTYLSMDNEAQGTFFHGQIGPREIHNTLTRGQLYLGNMLLSFKQYDQIISPGWFVEGQGLVPAAKQMNWARFEKQLSTGYDTCARG